MNRQQGSYVALGDSLTAGTGAEAGKGFVHLYHAHLAQALGEPIECRPFGTVGAKTGELLHQLQTDSVMRQAVAGASLITVTAGGNDLMQAAIPFFMEGRYHHLTKALRMFVVGSRRLLNTIHELKEQQDLPYKVLLISLYNPFPQVPISAVWVKKFNKYTQLLSRNGVVYVDIYEAFLGHVGDYLADDMVHPNDAGHRVIAQAVSRALLTSDLLELFRLKDR